MWRQQNVPCHTFEGTRGGGGAVRLRSQQRIRPGRGAGERLVKEDCRVGSGTVAAPLSSCDLGQIV